LSKEARKLAENIDIHLDHSLIKLLIAKLNRLKYCHNELYEFLEYKNYYLFARVLEKRNLQMVDYFLKNLNVKQCFIMLNYNNCEFIKKFIKVSKNLEWDADVQATVLPILSAILKIEPNWQVLEAIQTSLADSFSLSNPITFAKLTFYLSTITSVRTDKAAHLINYKKALITSKGNQSILTTPQEQETDLIQTTEFQSILQ
jgi:hypothetical protein